MHIRLSHAVIVATAAFAVSSCQTPDRVVTAAVAPPPDRIVAAENEPQNWLSHGRTYSEQRFSPLAAINSGNVVGLKLAWSYEFDTRRGQEATPLVVDGVMYTTSAWSKVQAIDAVTGKLLWQYDPEVPGESAVNGCCDVVNRGVAYWEGKLFVGTFDGRLIALDARTGAVLWSTLTVDPSKPYTITGAPRVVKGKVLIGNGGAELGVRGYISAYDARTGKMAWRFYTVPGEPGVKDGAASDAILEKLAGPTWKGEWWKLGGGGTVWDSMSYDPELDLLYVGVGNGSPWNAAIRSPGGGDNLFLSSIIALRPDTGEYVWHYQEVPGDQWDYTATQQMILADLMIDGKLRKVLMQAPKNGFFYVLDRETGKLISAEPFVKLNWASGVDLTTGRPNINPEARYNLTGKTWVAMPGSLGAHSWQSMSYSPQTGLVYIPTQEIGFPYISDPDYRHHKRGINLGVDLDAVSMPDDDAARKQIVDSAKGYLMAWDPVRQREVWRAPYLGPDNGGTLATAGGLVFEGDATGGFHAYDAGNGKELWSFPAQTGIIAAPITYSVGGKQYVTIVTGWGGIYALLGGEMALKTGRHPKIGRVLTFTLDGKASLPPTSAEPLTLFDIPRQFGTPAMIAEGKARYHRTCVGCHGDSAVSPGVLPDLRYSTAINDKDLWYSIVGDGALTSQGMVGFKADLSPEAIEAIRSYIISRTLRLPEAKKGS